MENKRKSTRLKSLRLIGIVVSYIVVASTAHAISLSFTKITNNSSIYDLSNQLQVVVNNEGLTSGGNTQASFTFYNHVGFDSDHVGEGYESSISEIYFDYGSNSSIFSSIGISDFSNGVAFTDDQSWVSPGNLPGGKNSIGFSSDYGADSLSPEPKNGIDQHDEFITFLAVLDSGLSYTDLTTALGLNDFRIGIHMTGLLDGESDSYASVVPIPAAGILFASVLLGAGGVMGRRKKHKSDIANIFARTS